LPQDGDLFCLCIHIFTLFVFPCGERFRKGAVVPVSSPGELANKGIMPYIQGLEPTLPPDDLRVPGISLFALREYCPYRMQFAMLTEEMIPAQFFRRDIPDSHGQASLVFMSKTHLLCWWYSPALLVERKKQPQNPNIEYRNPKQIQIFK
jgi:hypothetical protein